MTHVALIVKEDGKIYVNEVPEEPKYSPYHSYSKTSKGVDQNYKLADEKLEYGHKKALASAKENAVLCADQEQAQQIIIDDRLKRGDVPPFKYRGSLVIGLGEGIYPIPDLKWEVKEELEYPIDHTSYPPYRQVAILTLSEQPIKKFSLIPEEPRSITMDRTEYIEPRGEESQEELWKEIYMDFTDGEGWINFSVRMKSKYTITRNLIRSAK